MPDFLPPLQLPQGMAEQLINLRAQSGNPWAALAENLGKDVKTGMDNYRQRQANRPLTPEQVSVINKGQVPTGLNREQGLSLAEKLASVNAMKAKGLVPVDAGVIEVYKKAGLQPPTDPQVSVREFEAANKLSQIGESSVKGHTAATEEMLKNYPAIKKMGFQSGDMVPDRFLSEQEKPKGQTEQQKIRAEEFESKRWDGFVQKMDAAKASSRSLIGQAMQNNMRTRRALVSTNDVTAIPQQLDAAFADYAGVMKGGAPDQQSMEHMRVKTMAGEWANLKQFITSKPAAINTPEIQGKLKSMLNEVIKVDDNAINKWISYHEKANKELISKHPEEWKAMKQELSSITGADSAEAPKAGDIVDGHKFKGGDPSKQENWEKQ